MKSGNNPILITTAIGWVDDVAFLTIGDAAEESTDKLKALIPKALGLTRTHAFHFDAGNF